jgi:hypothetical protein
MTTLNIFLIAFLCIFVLSAGLLTLSYSENIVPDWIKNTAKWYGDGITSEQEYLDSIKFLIENSIITIDTTKETTTIEDPIILTPEESFADPRITTCDILYQSYVSQEQFQFRQEYSYISYVNDCIDLYQDKVWHYQGEDRLERVYNKFIEIHEQNIQSIPKVPMEPHVEIHSIIDTGNERVMIKFDICAGDVQLDKAKVLVKSDIETILIGSDKDISENSCRNYETQIYAKHPKNIDIEIVENVLAD